MMRKIIITLIFIFCSMAQILFAENDWIMETDNHDATFTGTWATSTARILYYGDNYRWTACSGNTESITATATFLARDVVDVDGKYSVFSRWVVDPNRSTQVRYYIYKDDGDTTPYEYITKNQEVNGGEWRYLGTYFFNKGDKPKVVIANNCPTEANGANVIADAIRWVKENISADDIVDAPGMEWASGNQSEQLTTTPTAIRSLILTAPAAGYVIINASGYFNFRSTGKDVGRCSITTTSTELDPTHMIAASDFGAPSTENNYTPFSATRGYSVSAGSNTFYLVCDAPSGIVVIEDTSLTGAFFPTRY